MKRKLLITLGGLSSIIAPIAAISCSCSSKSSEEIATTSNGPIKVIPTNPPVESNEKLNKAFFKSDIFEIVNNKALLDITKHEDQEKVREGGKGMDNIHHYLATYIDNFNVIEKERIALSKWYLTHIDNYEYIKFGFNVFLNDEIVFEGFKVKVDKNNWYQFSPTEIDFGGVYFVLEGLKSTDPSYKTTEDINEFNNPDW